MMTHSSQQQVLKDVRQLLANAKPEQTIRLLQDVLNATPAPKEPVKYDA